MGKTATWTPGELETLVRMANQGATNQEISEQTGRTVRGVELKRYKEGLSGPRKAKRLQKPPAPWTEDEDAILRDCLKRGMSYNEAAEHLPGRSAKSCAGRKEYLGIASALYVAQQRCLCWTCENGYVLKCEWVNRFQHVYKTMLGSQITECDHYRREAKA